MTDIVEVADDQLIEPPLTVEQRLAEHCAYAEKDFTNGDYFHLLAKDAAALLASQAARIRELEGHDRDADDQDLAFMHGITAVVEANSFEHHCLWEEFHQRKGWPWKQHMSGLLAVVGNISGMPVCISLMRSTVSGEEVLFWHATSQVADSRMIERWLERHLPATARLPENRINRTDAMNFHIMFQRARSLLSRKGVE